MELAIQDSPETQPISLLQPSGNVVIGGLRLFEIAALALCDRGRPRIYVEGPPIKVPTILDKLGCGFEVRWGEAPSDVPRLTPSQVLNLLKAPSYTCQLGTVQLVDTEPAKIDCWALESGADVIALNVEVMRLVIRRLRGLNAWRWDGDVAVMGRVRECTVVEGPAIIGPESVAGPLAYIRPGTVLYYGAVLRDEAKNAILDAYAHKAHSGYLGDSYVGVRANLGAGTTTSNLKNTLGPIRPRYPIPTTRTYRKLGAVIGDYAKTAIGTLIYGGRFIGPASHVYGVVRDSVPPLTIYEDGEAREMDPGKAAEILARDGAENPEELIRIIRARWAALTGGPFPP